MSIIREEIARVLVGIVSYNRATVLPKAIESALGQSYANTHVSVIDDGSTDRTAELKGAFPTVDWEIRTVSRGYMSARNEFMARPGFEFFASLDDDSWFMNGDEIAEALNIFATDSSVAAIAFDIASPDLPDISSRGAPREAAMFIGCGHILRLSAVRDVGAYENVPGGYGGEEKDLCIRLMAAGYKVLFVPGLAVWHDKTMVSRDIFWQHRSGVCNDLALVMRRAPWYAVPPLTLYKIARHLQFSWRNNLVRPCWAGLMLYARSMPMIVRGRKPVPFHILMRFLSLSRRTSIS